MRIDIFFGTPVLGYLDPGTGSYFIQVALASIAGVAVAVGVYWGRIRTRLGRLFLRRKAQEDNDNA
jgi:hypothetical protein